MSNATPGAAPMPNVKGAGKKATLAKRQLYSNPLPVGRTPSKRTQTEPLSWWDWFNELSKWVYDGASTAPVYRAWYDDMTKSVWMYDTGEAHQLWTQGFFGKGNLSRSEPTWVARKEAEWSARERGEMTAEQMTQRRREERKLLKIERARAAVKAGIQLPDGITALGGKLDEGESAPSGDDLWKGDEEAPTIEAGMARVKGLKHFSSAIPQKEGASDAAPVPADLYSSPKELEGVEHFQLTMVEAFFLAGMLGCLEVYDENHNVRGMY